ncbi:apoptosis-associated speck-like protein containing a CARD [Mantella aurantiaca]
MEKTVRDHLLEALNELESRSLKSFRNKLNDCTVKVGHNKIPKGQLQDKDPEDLATLILRYYGESYGIELTVSILKAINENQVAAELERLLENDSSTSGSASGSRSKKHFVDEHMKALIDKVSMVAPILDSLLSEDLLTYEEYETIRGEGTSYAQMRKLYAIKVKSWNDPQKDVFKKALRDADPILVKNLEQS